ncbi:class I mannose-6-phosphate isomerase [Sphingobium subterraneum]|uniref:Mannose-6-phosphate isomerase n=1 Tax=Sphingobium subterraneum TaxID=627688 RepID=A0A841IVP6_9SPHN|nr:class I mannose-6-phosphate isomerase [Sphingobium subterraneum]MBB6122414.1 mannose-6-phosphate isomerase [Sphingobium subterraneum]
MKLKTHFVEKPWGRAQLPAPFDAIAAQAGLGGKTIGEVWFEPEDGTQLPLLVKYIFTSEKLSVQVHPTDAQGHARGLPGGKTECWYILDAEPGANLGLGTVKPLDGEALRAAALDGSIEQLMDWKAVKPGEFYFVPAGTVHAIGVGVSLIEIQQNVDVTYRLYDYGRPRELHLDDGVAVSVAKPYPMGMARRVGGACEEQLLSDCVGFTVVYSKDVVQTHQHFIGRALWIVPLSGAVHCCGETAAPGGCLYVEPDGELTADPGTTALVGAAPRLT